MFYHVFSSFYSNACCITRCFHQRPAKGFELLTANGAELWHQAGLDRSFFTQNRFESFEDLNQGTREKRR